MKKSIGRITVTTAKELAESLEHMIDGARLASQADVRPTPDTIYVSINSDAVRLTLIEETLTDGSKVYNVELSEAVQS